MCIRGLLVVFCVGSLLSGCDGMLEDSSPGGCFGGKCDSINRFNDPSKLGFTIKYKLADESLIGKKLSAAFTPYSPPTYYPFTSDGINDRSGGKASPAEKYDLAFSGWSPEETFWSLKRLESTSDAEFDAEYYDKLGPVASWEHKHHGLGRMHDNIDNDKDGKTDLDDDDADGLQSWFGYCNGNTAASISVEGPRHAVTENGVEFTRNDIMALLAAVYYDDRSTMTGLRCNSESPRTDAHGRLVDQPWYRLTDLPDRPVVNFVVVNGPFWVDASRKEIGYRVVVNRDGRLDLATIKLDKAEFEAYDKDPRSGKLSFDGSDRWDEVEFSTATDGCRDTNPATLYLAVTHLLGLYRVPFAIDADSGSHVWNYPISEAIIHEQRIIERPEANKLLGLAEDQSYPFNSDAKKFAHVKLELTASHYMSLEMVLELDNDLTVIGGEWVGSSKGHHPDFIWVAMGADKNGFNTDGTYVTFGDDQLDADWRGSHGDSPDMRYSDVRLLLAKSRTDDDHTFLRIDGKKGVDLPQGQLTELGVEVNHPTHDRVGDVLVYLDIDAANVSGLKLTLSSPDGTEVRLFDVPDDTSGLGAGRKPVGAHLGTIRGVAHPMPLVDDKGNVIAGLRRFVGKPGKGKWTLRVRNDAGGLAKLNSWSLWVTARLRYRHLTPAEISAAWSAVQVPCVKKDGTAGEGTIPLLDRPDVKLFDGKTALQAAPDALKGWVGDQPSALVVFDINACEFEDTKNKDSDLVSAGLLVRGAKLVDGRLLLGPTTTTADLDYLNVSSAGLFEEDPGGVDDSKLSEQPQLVPAVTAAKQGLLDLAAK
jgi:subtilisin-like proprotein convertase family protein